MNKNAMGDIAKIRRLLQLIESAESILDDSELLKKSRMRGAWNPKIVLQPIEISLRNARIATQNVKREIEDFANSIQEEKTE